MKNFVFVLFILSIFFFSCNSKSNFPSRTTLDKIAKTDSKYERVSVDDICVINNLVSNTIIPNRIGMDLRTDEEIKIANLPEFRDELSIYQCRVVNDSIIMVEQYDPVAQKRSKEVNLGIWPAESKYIFHKNGDIEIKMGNMISDEYDSEDNRVLVSAYIDGKTGLILNFWRNDFGQDNYYYIDEDGSVVVGHDYDIDTAHGIFNCLRQDIDRIVLTYSKSVR